MDKISPEFGERIARLKPDERMVVIVLLDTGSIRPPANRRDLEARQQQINAVKQALAGALVSIDEALEQTSGKRLAEEPNALGAIPIEATADGISAVAASDAVKAIIEDQPISPLEPPKSR